MRGHVWRRRPPRALSRDRGGPQPIPGPRRGAMRVPGVASVLAGAPARTRDAGESRGAGAGENRRAGADRGAGEDRGAGAARGTPRGAGAGRGDRRGAGAGRGAPRGAGAGSGAGAGRGGSGAGAGAGRGASLGGGATTGGSIESGSRYACRLPASRTPKCRWGWTAERVPLVPTAPRRSPADTCAPSWTAIADRCRYEVSNPSPVRTLTVRPDEPAVPANSTSPLAAAITGVATGAAMSIPRCCPAA